METLSREECSKLSKEQLADLVQDLQNKVHQANGGVNNAHENLVRYYSALNHYNPKKIFNLHDNQLDIRDVPKGVEISKYPASTYIDLANSTVFDLESVTKEEMDAAMFTLRSMLHQILFLAGKTLPAWKRDVLTNLFVTLDEWEKGTSQFYFGMVEAIKGNNASKKNKPKSQAGNIGINKSMF